MFKIDLNGAVDVSTMDGPSAAANPINKTLFLDLVALLTSNGITAAQIPAKIEGLAFGPDVKQGDAALRTLWIANDNDFLETVADPGRGSDPEPESVLRGRLQRRRPRRFDVRSAAVQGISTPARSRVSSQGEDLWAANERAFTRIILRSFSIRVESRSLLEAEADGVGKLRDRGSHVRSSG